MWCVVLCWRRACSPWRLQPKPNPGSSRPASSRRRRNPDQPETQKPEEQEPQKYEETVVVSGSKTEQKLIDAPVTMTVITADTIENAPTRNFADLLRSVPGLNANPGLGTRHQRHNARAPPARWPPVSWRCSTAAASTRTSSAS